MNAVPLLFADHGDLFSALPFVAPALAVPVGMAVLIARDRLRRRRRRADEER